MSCFYSILTPQHTQCVLPPLTLTALHKNHSVEHQDHSGDMSMQQKNPAESFINDVQSTLKDMMGSVPSAVPFDFKAVLEAQRKNFQAITEANQRAFQGWQSLAQRQAEMVGQFVQDNSGLARETMNEGTPQDKFARQTEILKNACQKSIVNSQELGEIVRRCTVETAEVLNRRLTASLSEIKTTAKKMKDSE